MDADNIEQKVMLRLASYDLSKPTEVVLSFSDSDDEQPSDCDYDKNTTKENLNDINPSEETKNSLDLQSAKLNIMLKETETNKKRKSLDENNLLETKKRRHSDPNATVSEKALMIEPQKVQELCDNNPPPEIKTAAESPTNKAQEFVYINKLLYNVSESILYIMKAFSMHLLVQNSSQKQNQIDKSMTNFLHIKYKLFNLCFVCADNILIPNADKEGFIRQFIADTLKLGREKDIVCSQHQIEEILKDLLIWVADKRNPLKKTHPAIEQILENHKLESKYKNVLRKHLEEPLKPPPPYPEVVQSGNTMNKISEFRVNSNMPQQHTNFIAAPSANNTTLESINYDVMPKKVPTLSANGCPVIASNNTSTTTVFHGPMMPLNHGQTNDSETNRTSSTNSPLIFTNNSIRKPANVTLCNAAYNDIGSNDLKKTEEDVALKNLETYVNFNSLVKPLLEKPKGNVIFSSGPPGQQVSITVHPRLSQQIQQTNENINSTHTADYTVIQKPSSLSQQRVNGQLPLQNVPQQQLPQQQLPQQQLPQQLLPQHHLPQQRLRQQRLRQQRLPQQHLPQQQLPQQHLPQQQLPQQHLPQQQLPQPKLPQRALPKQQMSQQQMPQQQMPQQQMPQQQMPQQQMPQQHLPQQQLLQYQLFQQQLPFENLPLQSTLQQYLPHNRTANQPNNISDRRRFVFNQYQLQQPPSYHLQNTLPQNGESLYWQNQTKMAFNSTHQNQYIFPHSLPPYRPLEQNEQKLQPEMIRSSSNDSGFTSPLNFHSPAPINAQGDLHDDSGPFITHVTSYNPKAIAISDGICDVCGKCTKLKCMGCYQRYYCTSTCQEIDWFLHREDCKKGRRLDA